MPILHFENKDYFCLFYRDIYPIGWNIANGSSDDLGEMRDPERVILREFGEEIFICSSEEGKYTIYTYKPGRSIRPVGFQKKAQEEWERILGVGVDDLDKFEQRTLPVFWGKGPDRVRATVRNETLETGDYFLSVTPEDNGIEVDRIARVHLNVGGDLRLIDGELRDGQILNRIIGLFEVSGFERRLKKRDFRPDRYFYNGVKMRRDRFEKSVDDYLKSLRHRGLRSSKDIKKNQLTDPRFDLCPVTRSVIERYFDWLESNEILGRRDGLKPDQGAGEILSAAPDCEVFICHSSHDVSIAHLLFEYLRRKGVMAFFSPLSLSNIGESNFAKTIHSALNSAMHMVVVGTQAEYLRDGWVRYEWESFLNETLSKRKSGGQLLAFLENVEIEDLPYGLRQRKVVPFVTTSLEDSFRALDRYLRPRGEPTSGVVA